MSERVEVLIGPGTVIRWGRVTVWAGPTASPALLTFLHQSLRNVGSSARGGRQVVDHIARILSTRDPEPGVPFAAVGPADEEWAAILHGPVQLWDGTRWVAPSPQPGWLPASLTPQPALCVGPAGSAAPRVVPNSPYDLAAGMVPGGGFILVPEYAGVPRIPLDVRDPGGVPMPGGAGDASGHQDASGSPWEPGPAPLAAPAPVTSPTPPEATMPVPLPVAAPVGPPADLAPPAHPEPPLDLPTPDREPPPDPSTPDREPPADPVPSAVPVGPSLRAPMPSRPPLPPVGDADGPEGAGRPLVSGVRCPSGHFNHSRARRCARCRAELGKAPLTNGPRPPLGVLIADDGTVYRVDGDLVIGAVPAVDPAVVAGRATALRLDGATGSVAPTHAELRVSDWTVLVTDRGSAAGTHIVRPDQSGWDRLPPFRSEPLLPGSHLAFGQRVVTFVSPWPADAAED